MTPVLRRLLKKAYVLALLAFALAALMSLGARYFQQKQFAEQLGATVRNDLLIGNNAAVLKTLKQNIETNFTKIEQTFDHKTVTLLDASSQTQSWWAALIQASVKLPMCLDPDAKDCSTSLRFSFSLVDYLPWITLATALGLLFFHMAIAMLQKPIESYYRSEFQRHHEAHLGRLSARLCHDLKLPCLFFQKVFYLEDNSQFVALKPQLQSQLLRLYGMIEKLKRVDVEGLVRLEPVVLKETEFQSFLLSLSPSAASLLLTMPAFIEASLDLDKFERAIANLVLNGFQAGSSLVAVTLSEINQDLLVEIENNGPAMPPNFVEAFLSRDAGQFRDRLGLKMVKETVLAHGGRVHLESHHLRTRFILSFPDSIIKSQKLLLDPVSERPVVIEAPSLAAPERSLSPGKNFGPIWMDEDLISLLKTQQPAQIWEPFRITGRHKDLANAELVVTRSSAIMDESLQRSIPILMVSDSTGDLAWMAAFKSRLRIMRQNQQLPFAEFKA